MLRRIIAFLLTVSMIGCVLVGCASDKNDAPQTAGNSGAGVPDLETSGETVTGGKTEVTVILDGGDPTTLDPFIVNSTSRDIVLMQVYERLADYGNDGGGLIGVLAKDWKKDGLTYTVNLWENIYDTDGNHFTADDAIWCLETVKEMGTNTNLVYIDELKKVNDYSFQMVLNSDVAGIFGAICTNMYMVTRAAYEASEDSMAVQPVGTGVYKVTDYQSGISVTLEKNENYWQSDENRLAAEQWTNVDVIHLLPITESSQIVIAMENGDADYAAISFANASHFDSIENIAVSAQEKRGLVMLHLNMSTESLFRDDIELRKAVLYGIPNEDLIDAMYNGMGNSVFTYGLKNHPDVDNAWENDSYFEYDLDYAKECLAKSNYNGEEISILVQAKKFDAAAEVIQAYLSMIGIQAKVNALDSTSINNIVRDPSAWDLYVDSRGCSDYAATAIRAKLDASAYSDGLGSFAFVQDDTLQSLVEAAIHADTNSVETVGAVHQYLIDNAITKGLFELSTCSAMNTDKIVEMFCRDTKPCIGAATYVWNE